MAALRPGLIPGSAILHDLSAAGCPIRFRDLGISPDSARSAILFAKDVRSRYTVLHLAWEFGMLERWTDQILPDVC